MENTLDSIRPSENSREEMSYIFGRDPSILAYNQRPFPSKDTKKNLLSLYETEETESTNEPSENSKSQTVKVYLRLKPFPRRLTKRKLLTDNQKDAFQIIDSTTLFTRLPMLDKNMSIIKQSKCNEVLCKKFTFSQTFGSETSQSKLFDQTVQQQMTYFLAGHNCALMTYGTTNSGKSYTLHGTITSPGLIPRALEFIFASVRTESKPLYKPLHHSDIVSLNAFERAQELEAKTKLLALSSMDKHLDMISYNQMQKLLQKEIVQCNQLCNARYAIWVSFAEIYNETIYDLLAIECQKKRVPLKLGTDSNGRAFIKGLKTIYVNSAAEAHQVLMAGQHNLKVAATALNTKSSRSHCIFTITLLKYYAENAPDTIETSMFSFCDLAGSERLKKTLNIGDRLKEAQNINTSLLVLRRCLKSIHEGQSTRTRTRTETIGPFRESKLTRLFQRALSGKEHLAIIVNINPLPIFYAETQNVLNFAAIAKKIVIEKKETQRKLKSRFSQIVTQSIRTVTDWESTDLESVSSQYVDTVESTSEYITSEEYMDLTDENKKLKEEISALKNSILIRDFQSRQEMADKYVTMIKDLEIEWKQRINDMETQHEDTLEWTVKKVEEFYNNKLNELHRKKRKHSDCSDNSDENSDLDSTFQDLNKRNQQLMEKNESLKKTLTELKATNETLTVEKNKICFELGLSKDNLKVTKNLLETAEKNISLNKDGKAYVDEMTLQLRTKGEQIKNLKEILNEAKEEYIGITTDMRKKEHCIDEQAKIIIENEEKIEDLESQLEEANLYLIPRNTELQILQEKLDQQSKELSGTVAKMQEEIDQLKNEKLALLKFYETTTSRTSTQSEYQEIIIREELIVDDATEDTNNITKNMQAKIEETIKDVERVDPPQTEMADDVIDTSKIDLNLSDPIRKTPLKNDSEPHLQLDTTYCKPSKVLVDIGCQVDITYDKDYDTNHSEKSLYSNKSAQTIMTTEDMQTANKALNEKIETLEAQLLLAIEEKQKIEGNLQSSNVVAQQEIADHKLKIDQLEKDLSNAKDNAERYLENLQGSQEELNNYILKYKKAKEEYPSPNKIVPMKEDVNDELVQQINEQAQRNALELEERLETITKLKTDIIQLNENLETCQMERDYIQKSLDQNEKKLLQLENRLQMASTKEQDKDTEITTLQKELKSTIQRNENIEKSDDTMKAELKDAINELRYTKETLCQKDQYIKELKLHLESFERSAKVFNLLETNAKEQHIDNERLRNANGELRITVTQKEHEMDAFIKNRDETVTKYETLVKNQQEELDREKREVMRYQELFRRQLTPTPNKDDYKKLQNRIETLQDRLHKYEISTKAKSDNDSTSEDESSARQPKRRGRRKAVATAKQEEISVIELSGSETKRCVRRNALPPPETSTEKKLTTRRKKLFVADDSLADIEPAEIVPKVSTRSLRSRRK